jgi:hypothetical protein
MEPIQHQPASTAIHINDGAQFQTQLFRKYATFIIGLAMIVATFVTSIMIYIELSDTFFLKSMFPITIAAWSITMLILVCGIFFCRYINQQPVT